MTLRKTASLWWRTSMGVMQTLDERNVVLIAAGAGFFTMLAIFPGIAALIAIWGLVADPSVIEAQLELLDRFVPADAFAILDAQLTTLMGTQTETLGWTTAVSMVLSLWWTRAGVASLVRGLNAVYREDHRGTIMRYVSSMLLTLVLTAVALVTLLAVVVAPIVMRFLPQGPEQTAIEVSRWVIAAVSIIIGLGALYRFGPNRRGAKVPWVSAGALIAALLWGIASYGFSLYLANFGRYNEVYGSLGAVVALLMWLYLSAFITLLGAAINAELELRTLEDTTVGPDRPMGERGAFVADTYVKN